MRNDEFIVDPNYPNNDTIALSSALPKGIAQQSITLNGHMYIHVAACPCSEMSAEVKRLGTSTGNDELPNR